jgi:phospholipase C
MHRASLSVVIMAAIIAAFSLSGASVAKQPDRPDQLPSRIKHVIIIVQENRTPDNLFQGLPGADIAKGGYDSTGKYRALVPRPLANRFDLDHSHAAFVTEYNGGKMNGWDHVKIRCHKPCAPTAFGYVPRAQMMPYWIMATTYTFGDRTFQDNQGPSFPAHQYLFAGTSTNAVGSKLMAAENPRYPGKGGAWVSNGPNCDKPGGQVTMIDQAGNETVVMQPCFDHPTLGDLLDRKHVSWRYYDANNDGYWSAPDAIKHMRFGPDWANVVTPETTVLSDIKNGNLADVSWVNPTCAESDHALCDKGTGPAWVASIVNAVGTSKYWDDTAIFVTWDDWGGWFDHVKPVVLTSYEMGFRVPLIVISPFAKRGYVSHVQHEQASILRFVEDNFRLGTMGYADSRADNLADCFDFHGPGHKFALIPTPGHRVADFMNQPLDTGPTDDDF